MNEIKDLTFTLSYDYGNLKRYKNIYNREEYNYTIDDLLDEIDNLYSDNQDKENEIDELKSEIEDLNNRIREYEEKEREMA